MPLAPYSEKYWFPDGTLAVGQLLHVFPRNSETLAQLYADQAGTMPIANPTPISAGGFATFYVENGDYWGYINGQAFYLVIDLDPNLTHVWPATVRSMQSPAAMVWNIFHGLNSFPGVTVLDTNNDEVFGEVNYIDDDSLTITFATPVEGTAFLRR